MRRFTHNSPFICLYLALALLERAQRIDPDSAQIYLAMARTHEASGDGSQARATANAGCYTAVAVPSAMP